MSPRLKVAWFGHAVGRRSDGLTTYSAEAAAGLSRMGCQVFFHHSASDGDTVPVPEAQEISWKTFRFKTVTVPGPGFKAQMEEWLAANRPDVAHCSLSFTLADGWLGEAARRQGSAAVATFHLPFGSAGSGRGWTMTRLHRFWIPRLHAYQKVIVFSEPHREQLAALGMEPRRLEVIPNAVDTGHFSPGESRLRRRFFPEAGPVFGYAGRLDPEKGVSRLLEAFSKAGVGPLARLIVAGGGSLEQKVRVARRRDPRVIYIGQLKTLDERIDFWRAMDLFCLPSTAEGLSLSLLEAMSCGRPVAVTPAGGGEAVAEGTFALDPVRITGSLIDLMEQVAAAPERAQEMGGRARSYVERHHGIQPMLDHLLQLYQDCRGRGASSR